MAWQQCLMDLFVRIAHDLEQVLAGLTVDDLHYQPGPTSNSIGWLAWHLTRSHDRNISELAGQEQLWITEGWYAKFNRAPDPTETGGRAQRRRGRRIQGARRPYPAGLSSSYRGADTPLHSAYAVRK